MLLLQSNQNKTTMTTTFFHRGTEIVKIENDFFGLNQDFNEDFIYVSRGFKAAIERGLEPTTEMTDEWHHYFVKDEDYGYKAKKIFFNLKNN